VARIGRSLAPGARGTGQGGSCRGGGMRRGRCAAPLPPGALRRAPPERRLSAGADPEPEPEPERRRTSKGARVSAMRS
jgi:hypothetical protein